MRRLCHLLASSSRGILIGVGLLAFVTAVGGCSPVNWTMRAGVTYPPKSVPCDLTFATQDPLRPWNMNTHQLLGTIVAERFKGSWDEELKTAVQKKACLVGADMAAINLVTVNPWNGVQSANIMVYRLHGKAVIQTATAPVPTKDI
jgi:hypothetical protein